MRWRKSDELLNYISLHSVVLSVVHYGIGMYTVLQPPFLFIVKVLCSDNSRISVLAFAVICMSIRFNNAN
jgi:hypothetical protein